MTNTLQTIITKSPVLAIFIVFWAGFIASLSSCTIIRIPIVFGYVSGATHYTKRKSFLSALCLALGLITSYTFLGVALILLKNLAFGLVQISRYLYLFLGVVLLVLGIFYAGLIKIGKAQPAHCEVNTRIKKRSFIGSFLFGIMFAFLEMPACPCCASVLFVIASIVGFWNSWVYSFVIFLSFAVGQSMPILLIGSSTTLVKHLSSKAQRLERYTQFIAGNILIAIALLFFIIA
ncbi:MAG TPA: cytochrome c biogenesis protein CcdA [Candidatus Margulisiibacteriota bacterium]|nr:cytochrome c biogenesis protein CcdA [Candidatus Margulisiibacteriota bacterium]